MTLNLYISFSANDDLELTSNIAKIEECLHDLDKWMSLNKLKLNQTKTKLNFFTSTQSIALNGPYPHFVLDLIQSSRLHFSRNNICILTIKESEGEEGGGFQGGACLTLRPRV